LAEGEFNGSALLMVCRAVHAGLDGWPVDEMEGGWGPVFTFSYVDAKLSVLVAVSEIDVDFAAVWSAVDKEVGDGGWEDWWSGRRRHVVQSCARVHDVSHILLILVGKESSDRSTFVSF
jgi:hypothetical protein